ncbi:MAG: hypothetical protein WB555_05225, partial [Candidatus Korobacteraceae bacterium]
ISTGHRDGDGHIRFTEPNRRGNRLHQLKQAKTEPGRTRVRPPFSGVLHGILSKKGSSSQITDSGVHSFLRHHQKSRMDIYEALIQRKLCGIASCNRTILKVRLSLTHSTLALAIHVYKNGLFL